MNRRDLHNSAAELLRADDDAKFRANGQNVTTHEAHASSHQSNSCIHHVELKINKEVRGLQSRTPTSDVHLTDTVRQRKVMSSPLRTG
jgi:hypothetical protein